MTNEILLLLFITLHACCGAFAYDLSTRAVALFRMCRWANPEGSSRALASTAQASVCAAPEDTKPRK
jgi:hypothetical protein